MAYWFGLHWADIVVMPFAELDEYVSRLSELPPIGGVIQYELP